MVGMFQNAKSFNQCLKSWEINKECCTKSMFLGTLSIKKQHAPTVVNDDQEYDDEQDIDRAFSDDSSNDSTY